MGTGYKAPSLYQLYDGINGNESLAPEKSKSKGLGIVWQANHRSTLEDSLFWNDYLDLIDYDASTQKYFNVSNAKTQGLEVTWDYQILDNLQSTLNYTYLQAKNQDSQQALLHRPKNTVKLSLDYTLNESGNFMEIFHITVLSKMYFLIMNLMNRSGFASSPIVW